MPESDDALAHLEHIVRTISQRGCFSYLAVLKYHGEQKGLLSFSSPGFSLALDFPNTKKVHALLEEIDAYVSDIGGRVYLAKDARLSSVQFLKMYHKSLSKWQTIVRTLDPEGKLNSLMNMRLKLR